MVLQWSPQYQYVIVANPVMEDIKDRALSIPLLDF